MKKLGLLLSMVGGFAWMAQAAEPALLLPWPGVKIEQQMSQYVQFYLNPNPLTKDGKVHEIYVYVGQTELTGRVAITLEDDGGVLFSTNDLMEGSYRQLGMAIVRIELERKLSDNLNSVVLKTVRAQSRLVENPKKAQIKP